MGKVHGSLARAGKVKSQTPKVEKQESELEEAGRSRIQEADVVCVVQRLSDPRDEQRRGPSSFDDSSTSPPLPVASDRCEYRSLFFLPFFGNQLRLRRPPGFHDDWFKTNA